MRIELSNDRADRPKDPVERAEGVFAHLEKEAQSPAEAARIGTAHGPEPARKRPKRTWLPRDVMRALTTLYGRLRPPS